MHVGLVTACYEPVINGVTRMVSLYKVYLEKLGHRVTIFTFGNSSTNSETSDLYRSPGIPLGTTGYFLSPRYSSPAQKKLQELDIIHCHHLLMGLEFAHRYGHCPVIFTNHTRYDLYLEAYTRLPHNIVQRIMGFTWPRLSRKSDAVIVPTHGTCEILRKHGIVGPIRIIPNGIELSKFSSSKVSLNKRDLGLPDNAIVAIYVGRLSSEKNLSVLIEEFRIAHQINRRLYMLLIGAGPLSKKLENTIRKTGLEDNIHLIGQVDSAQIPAYLGVGDFFVTASTSEVHPLTILEAMASGLPIVAFSSPGTESLVKDGKSGLLANERSYNLADKMTVMAASKSIRRKLSFNAILESKKYDIRQTISRTLSLYDEILVERRLSVQ